MNRTQGAPFMMFFNLVFMSCRYKHNCLSSLLTDAIQLNYHHFSNECDFTLSMDSNFAFASIHVAWCCYFL